MTACVPGKPKPRPPAARDRAATSARLVAAVGRVLADRGFAGFGVNAVAAEAGVDKVLIYRYFGGLPGLMTAYGRSGDFWPTVDELVGGDLAALKRRPVEEQVATVLRNLIAGLRRRPLTQEILAWETVERNELTAILEEVRERTGDELFALLGDEMAEGVEMGADAGAGVDVAAVTALLVAAINYLVVRARKIRLFATLDIRSDEGWRRIEAAVDLMARRALTSPKKGV